MTRLNETCALAESGAPEFSSVSGRANRVDLAWSRDGASAPGPGAGGGLLVFRVDALARQLVARTEDGRRFLVEIPLDDVDPEAVPAVWGELRNAILDEIWRNRAVAASSVDRAPVSLGFDLHPPLLVCNEKGVIFHPPWPGDGAAGPLEVCRDDQVLALAGLPPHAFTHQRFLHNPAASRVGAGATLYTASPDASARGGGRVRSRDEFLIDLASRVAATPGEGPRRSEFACAGCDESARCYPPPGAAGAGRGALAPQRVDAVAFYPFRVMARPLDVLSFGEHADLLGGATWRPFRTRHVRGWDQPGRARAREDLQATTFADVGQTTPLQAFTRKVALFEAVVRAVAELHRTFGQPHLGLDPDTVVSLATSPRRDGTYDVDLQGELRCAPLRDDRTPPPGAPVWLPPPGLTAPFAARDLLAAGRRRRDLRGAPQHEFAYGVPFAARVTVGRIWGGPSPEPTDCELQLAAEHLARAPLDPTDLVKVEIKTMGWENVVLWCRLDTERPVQAGSVAFRAHPVVLDSGQRRDLEAAATGGALFADATVHRTYGAWYDLHALGMLALRLLLDNANQSFEDVVRDVLPALMSVARSSRVRSAADPWSELVAGVGNAVATPPLDRFLASGNACFFGAEIGSADDVPAELWAEMLALVVASASSGERVSFAATTRLERDRGAFSAPVDSLLARLVDLRARLPEAAAEPPVLAEIDAAWDDDEPVVPVDDEAEELRREVKRLTEALTGQAAKLARLESEREDVERVRREAQRESVRDPRADSARASWDALLAAATGTSSHGLPPPTPGDPSFELLRAVVSDGLDTISGLLGAAAELGGQEFALQQSSVARRVRRALLSGDPAELQAAAAALDEARRRLGGLIAALVDAHAESTREGTRIALTTLEIGMQRELGLGRKETAKLQKLIERMKDRVGDLCAKVYDPTFQKALREHIRSSAGRGGHTS